MSQDDRIERLFKIRPNEDIPLPEIQHFAAQYNARIFELRRKGMHIENKTKIIDGKRHSWYRYIPEKSLQYEGNQQMFACPEQNLLPIKW